ncbi:hypothetical protein ZTR_04857 [Talaromyces verruculosus]|nr:hypothetical protein ZTR_04857 [Talaromyces verruculosus]
MAFQGKVIAITGAASGMGLATAKLLADRGACISLADLNEQGLKTAIESLPTEHGNKHIYTVVDVRNSSAVNKWIEDTVELLGQLDGAVNMAGVILPVRPVTEETEERFSLVLDVNVKGIFHCTRAQIKHMKAGGSIVSAASIYGQIGAPGVASYCASKSAVIGYTRAVAKENPRIRINCVSPGVVDTPMLAGEPEEDVARDLANSFKPKT